MNKTIKLSDDVYDRIMKVVEFGRINDTVSKIMDYYDTHELLLDIGSKRETYADIIKRLVEYYEQGHPK